MGFRMEKLNVPGLLIADDGLLLVGGVAEMGRKTDLPVRTAKQVGLNGNKGKSYCMLSRQGKYFK